MPDPVAGGASAKSAEAKSAEAKSAEAKSAEAKSPETRSAEVMVAGAKLTRSLRIVGVRNDGYHLLEAEMITLDLIDTLTFRHGSDLQVHGPAARHVPTDGSNLVSRALGLVGRRAGVRLHKRIPPGAGLGGGSADAAAVLRWAGQDDPALAAKLGADVPFCLRGGRARVTGVGEEIEPLPFEEVAGREFTLLIPPFGVSTVAVYRCWDDLGGPQGPGPNDLERAALKVEPRLAAWRDRLGEATGASPILAGSGSTWFVEGRFPGRGRRVVRASIPWLVRSDS